MRCPRRWPPARLAIKVGRQAGQAAGRLMASVKGTVVGQARLKHGRATMILKKLGVGVWKAKVAYLGDDVTNASKTTVRVRVVR